MAEASSCFPSTYSPPNFPSVPTPTFVPSLAPVAHVGEDRDRGLFSPQDRQAQASYMAIPTMLKARAPRRCGEPSAVPEDRKRGCCYRGQHRQRLGGGVCEADGRQRVGGSGYGERGGVQGHSALSATLPLGRKLGNQTRRFSHTLGTASAETGGQDQFQSHTE